MRSVGKQPCYHPRPRLDQPSQRTIGFVAINATVEPDWGGCFLPHHLHRACQPDWPLAHGSGQGSRELDQRSHVCNNHLRNVERQLHARNHTLSTQDANLAIDSNALCCGRDEMVGYLAIVYHTQDCFFLLLPSP